MCEHKTLAIETMSDVQGITYCDASAGSLQMVMLRLHYTKGSDVVHMRGMEDVGNNEAVLNECVFVDDERTCQSDTVSVSKGVAWLLELWTIYQDA